MIDMERHLNHTVVADLETELKDTFANIKMSDLNLHDITMDEFVEQLSKKSKLSKEKVTEMVEEKINYIYSKRLG
ncbi:hypothetical protein IMPERIA75_200116 [Imperialibacter sp. 75]|nr:hypothetical protein IMPERIA75_200116 [Imperialibacter sp. 75]